MSIFFCTVSLYSWTFSLRSRRSTKDEFYKKCNYQNNGSRKKWSIWHSKSHQTTNEQNEQKRPECRSKTQIHQDYTTTHERKRRKFPAMTNQKGRTDQQHYLQLVRINIDTRRTADRDMNKRRNPDAERTDRTKRPKTATRPEGQARRRLTLATLESWHVPQYVAPAPDNYTTAVIKTRIENGKPVIEHPNIVLSRMVATARFLQTYDLSNMTAIANGDIILRELQPGSKLEKFF